MAGVGGFAGSSNWLGAHAGEWVPLRGAAMLWDLVHPWSSFSKGMETGGGHCCQPEPGLGLSCLQVVLGLWAVIAMDYVSELALG